MKMTTLKNHFRDSLRNLMRNGWMSVAAISAVGVTLLLVGIFLSAVFNINKFSQDVEGDVRVRVSISQGTKEKERKALETKIKKLNGVTDIEFSSKEKELEKLVKVYGKSILMVKGDSNPLKDMLLVQAKTPQDTKKIAKEVKKFKNVSEVTYGGNNAQQLFNTMARVRQIALIFSLVLLLVAIFLIANTIRITIISRSNEIEIMQLVGATDQFIRTPFIIEGALTGLIGAIIPIILVDFTYQAIYNSATQKMVDPTYSLLRPGQMLFGLDALILLIGAGIGALGAVISIRRYLKLN